MKVKKKDAWLHTIYFLPLSISVWQDRTLLPFPPSSRSLQCVANLLSAHGSPRLCQSHHHHSGFEFVFDLLLSCFSQTRWTSSQCHGSCDSSWNKLSSLNERHSLKDQLQFGLLSFFLVLNNHIYKNSPHKVHNSHFLTIYMVAMLIVSSMIYMTIVILRLCTVYLWLQYN